MNKYRFICMMLISSFIFTNLVSAMQVTPQELMAFGEIRAIGVVQIESSTGKWVDMAAVYPLLKNTKLKTQDGIVSITAKDGSSIVLSKDTEAAIYALNGRYTVNLVKGTISFNVCPSPSLTVTTKEATVSVTQQIGGYNSLVAGVGAPSPANIQGIVFCSDKGTEVRSVSGKMNVSFRGLPPNILNTGERLFASSADLGEGVTAAAAPAAGTAAGSKLVSALIVGAFFTTGTITAFESFRGTGVASPSGFRMGSPF